MTVPVTPQTVDDPLVHDLSPSDAARLLDLASSLREAYVSTDNPALAADAPLILRQVPDTLTRFLREFHRTESAGAIVVRGMSIDDAALGPTPPRYDPPMQSDPATTMDFYLMLIAHSLGEPFAWSNLQGGRLVHNVLPVSGHETQKSGTSSLSTLELHTEDACHPARADYLILLCLRNDDAIPTVYASVADAQLDAEVTAQLERQQFLMRSEPDHVTSPGESLTTSVLFGNPAHPYLTYDGYYLSAAPDDPDGQAALAHLTKQLDKAAKDVVLRPGELVILDNFRAVHGRRPFEPRYDGRDRWLKRVHVTRDLRRSSRWRGGAVTPVIMVRPATNQGQ